MKFFLSKAMLALAIPMVMALPASAQQYMCTVNCLPSGQTTATVSASSASQAASMVDKQGHQICQAAGYSKATPQTMSESQCSRK
jgi:hypothetical protein